MNLIFGVIKKIIRKILPKKIIIYIYRFLAKKYIYRLKVSVDPARKTIIALNHFYDQDIYALKYTNKNFNFISIDSPYLFKGAKLFFREDIQGLLAPYISENKINIIRYRHECSLILKALREKFGVDVIVTASDNYYWIRELIQVAREQGVKTFVLDKEGLISPFDFEELVERTKINAPFISDHLFVWSERQREFWQKIGVNKESITVIGQPRSDLFYQPMNYTADLLFEKKQPLITFFTYADDAYIPLDNLKKENLSWKKMKTETQEYLFELSINHPEYNFIFKAHPQQHDLEELKKQYKRSNLCVVGGSSLANELIIRSELIIAFQTTSILEAMFMNKKIIYTEWDPAIEKMKDLILPFGDANGLVVAKSFEQFKIVCSKFFNEDQSDFKFTEEEEKNKHEMVNKFLYKPDGNVCKRFYEEIDRLM